MCIPLLGWHQGERESAELCPRTRWVVQVQGQASSSVRRSRQPLDELWWNYVEDGSGLRAKDR